jgi:aminopeptidase N
MAFLAEKDPDPCKRWEASQELSLHVRQNLIDRKKKQVRPSDIQAIINAIRSVILDQDLDDGIKAEMMRMPTASNLADVQARGTVDPLLIYNVRKQVTQMIGQRLEDHFLETYQAKQSNDPYVFTPTEMNRRKLMNNCLSYLVPGQEEKYLGLARNQFEADHNFNDVLSALNIISEVKNEEIKQACFAKMYRQWKDNKLVMNKWIRLRISSAHHPLAVAKELEQDQVFDAKNPNKVRALVGGFTENTLHFHHEDGSGYAFMADWIIRLDAINPLIAGAMAKVFTRIGIYIERIRQQQQEQMQRIRAGRGDRLSSNVKEVLDRSAVEPKR